MVKNDCGIYISGTEKSEIENSGNYLLIVIGKEKCRYGYSLRVEGKISGYGYGLADRDLKYTSRKEMLIHMKSDVLNQINAHCDGDQILKNKFIELIEPKQLTLF